MILCLFSFHRSLAGAFNGCSRRFFTWQNWKLRCFPKVPPKFDDCGTAFTGSVFSRYMMWMQLLQFTIQYLGSRDTSLTSSPSAGDLERRRFCVEVSAWWSPALLGRPEWPVCLHGWSFSATFCGIWSPSGAVVVAPFQSADQTSGTACLST